MSMDVSKSHDFNYCQRLYAALGNNIIVRHNAADIIAQNYVKYSWRASASLVAKFRSRAIKSDYTDFYIAGYNIDELNAFNHNMPLAEGIISDDIRADLLELGWLITEG